MDFISHEGALFEDIDFGSEPLGNLRVRVAVECSLFISTVSDLTGLTVPVTTNCSINIGAVQNLTLNCSVQTEATLKSYVLRSVPGTAKTSSYTILPPIATHGEIAADNLLYQFKGCPNIESLINIPMLELDKAQTDVYEFQSKVLNLEESEGVNLDLCGKIVGRTRITNDEDLVYRTKLITQVFINVNDGTIPKMLSALLLLFNLEPNYTSFPELQLKTTTFNTMELFVRDKTVVDIYSNTEELEGLVAAGGAVEILVQDRTTPQNSIFTLSGYDGQPADQQSSTTGLGSLYDETVGGSLVGLYNYELYYQVPGEDTGADLKITNKEIPVSTFN